MNDFTKKELHIIHGWSIDRLEGVGLECFREDGHVDLYDKVGRMIDSYCDHADHLKTNDCQRCHVQEFICNICGHVYFKGI